MPQPQKTPQVFDQACTEKKDAEYQKQGKSAARPWVRKFIDKGKPANGKPPSKTGENNKKNEDER